MRCHFVALYSRNILRLILRVPIVLAVSIVEYTRPETVGSEIENSSRDLVNRDTRYVSVFLRSPRARRSKLFGGR